MFGQVCLRAGINPCACVCVWSRVETVNHLTLVKSQKVKQMSTGQSVPLGRILIFVKRRCIWTSTWTSEIHVWCEINKKSTFWHSLNQFYLPEHIFILAVSQSLLYQRPQKVRFLSVNGLNKVYSYINRYRKHKSSAICLLKCCLSIGHCLYLPKFLTA